MIGAVIVADLPPAHGPRQHLDDVTVRVAKGTDT
jgi:hypothetical protein